MSTLSAFASALNPHVVRGTITIDAESLMLPGDETIPTLTASTTIQIVDGSYDYEFANLTLDSDRGVEVLADVPDEVWLLLNAEARELHQRFH